MSHGQLRKTNSAIEMMAYPVFSQNHRNSCIPSWLAPKISDQRYSTTQTYTNHGGRRHPPAAFDHSSSPTTPPINTTAVEYIIVPPPPPTLYRASALGRLPSTLLPSLQPYRLCRHSAFYRSRSSRERGRARRATRRLSPPSPPAYHYQA